jgi:hypothetical protein
MESYLEEQPPRDRSDDMALWQDNVLSSLNEQTWQLREADGIYLTLEIYENPAILNR